MNGLRLGMKNRRRWSLALIYTLLTIGAAVVIYPFFFMVMNSVKPGPEILHDPLSLPTHITWNGYVEVFRSLDILNLFKNSLIISGSVTILNVLLSAMVAFALAKIDFPGRNLLFLMVLGTMMVPAILLLIPKYTMLFNWGWVNTYKALILPVAVQPYNIFLIRQFYKQIPDDFLDAAKVDGCNLWGVFWRILLPMSAPVLVTVAVLSFMGAWNDLLEALLYLRDDSLYTVQLGLYSFQSEIPGKNAEQLWAATTLVTLPVVLLFFWLQRYFIRAFSGVGLK
ncbi:carbohydrate ABC transporter permease [Desmospora activa]|uniref:Carbohydrate ABC transporter membrane protein 2 (CUT1 family) n=1 Tax=Desmospora activa DSM 45169 TaxID=1121389 RepID=A0A2T4ZCM6_9BACL|nr:carbohydrate ABC transporter permease [Desmospora activa]PTM59645.1 carbohydrate ABC transporter membrane protein 2 (CUT1 family) [Desmospora activa DSM 45169]